MLGAPTKSEAAKISSDYAESAALYELGEKLDRFRDVFTGVFPHNHVVGSYRDAGRMDLFPVGGYIWNLDRERCPRRVRELLKPELVRDHYLKSSHNFREVLNEARGMIDRDEESVIQTPDHTPYAGLYPIVTVEESPADYVIQGNGWVHIEGEGKGWKYTFNPYQLAVAVLDAFEANIENILVSERGKLRQIAMMMLTAKAAEEDPNYKLVENIGRRLRSYSHIEMERDPENPVGELYLHHQEVLGRSDLLLGFNERCFSSPSGRAIPAEGLLDADNRMKYYNLWLRMGLREIVDQALGEKSGVVINGVAYKKTILTDGSNTFEGFSADGQSFQEIANLFGEPIQQPDGVVVWPEEWASEEMRLVRAYSMYRDPNALETLLQLYDFDSSSGHPSREKAIKQLEYSLGIDQT